VVAILMTDVEPAVRLNAALEAAGVTTVTISPMDDVRGDVRRARPEIVVFTGALRDAANMALVRQLLWDNVAMLGFTDVAEPQTLERLRDIGYAEIWVTPVAWPEFEERHLDEAFASYANRDRRFGGLSPS
jgi:hypothetical protein